MNISQQDLRDIFNQNGLNYSQIVGDELTTVSMELQDFNYSLTQITDLFVSQFLEALPEKEAEVANDPYLGYALGFNAALTQIKDTIGRKWGK